MTWWLWLVGSAGYVLVGLPFGRYLAAAQVRSHHSDVLDLKQLLETYRETSLRYEEVQYEHERLSRWQRRARFYAGRALWAGTLFWWVVAVVLVLRFTGLLLGRGTVGLLPSDVTDFPLTDQEQQRLEREALDR